MELFYQLLPTPTSTLKLIIEEDYYLLLKGGKPYSFGLVDQEVGVREKREIRAWRAIEYSPLEQTTRHIIYTLPPFKDALLGEDCSLFLSTDGAVYVNGVFLKEGKSLHWKRLRLPPIKKCLFYDGSYYFLSEEGQLYVAGENPFGRLGTGDYDEVLSPELVCEYPLRALSATKFSTFLLSEVSTLYHAGTFSLTFPKTSATWQKLSLPPLKRVEQFSFLTETGLIYRQDLSGGFTILHLEVITEINRCNEVNFYSAREALYSLKIKADFTRILSCLPLPFEVKQVQYGKNGLYLLSNQGEVYICQRISSNTTGVEGLGKDLTKVSGLKVEQIIIRGKRAFLYSTQGKLYAERKGFRGSFGTEQKSPNPEWPEVLLP